MITMTCGELAIIDGAFELAQNGKSMSRTSLIKASEITKKEVFAARLKSAMKAGYIKGVGTKYKLTELGINIGAGDVEVQVTWDEELIMPEVKETEPVEPVQEEVKSKFAALF